VLLGIPTSFKEDLQASVAELVSGEPLRISGELLVASPTTGDPSELITHIRRHFKQLWPVPVARNASLAAFVHKDMTDSTHVFLRQDTVRRTLYPPYSGPYNVLARTKKTLRSPSTADLLWCQRTGLSPPISWWRTTAAP